ncbi:MAG: hypothetical protein ILO36_01975 [Abditibacteriota bacterium]|nr:hypothetical protein [Abditibacteriota bacterium]
MKKTLAILLLVAAAAAARAGLLAPCADTAVSGAISGSMAAGRAYRLTAPGTYRGSLNYTRQNGKTGSAGLYFEDTGWYIPYEDLSGAAAEGAAIGPVAEEKPFVYNGRLYRQISPVKETAVPEKVFKTADSRLGLGILKNGRLSLNVDFKRQYFRGASGFLCQAPDGLYALDRAEFGKDSVVFSCPEINARAEARFVPEGSRIKITGSLGPLDPALPCLAETIAMHLALGPSLSESWRFMNDLTAVTVADGQLQELCERPFGAPFFYPLAVMFPKSAGYALALAAEPGSAPANISGSGHLGSFYAVFKAENCKCGFSLSLSKTSPEWGMREAFRDYADAHPECFSPSGSAETAPEKQALENNGSYGAVAGSFDGLSLRECMFARAMAYKRPVYCDTDKTGAAAIDAAAEALAFGFIPRFSGDVPAAAKAYAAAAEKLQPLGWLPVPLASSNNPAVTTERFGDEKAEKYYLVCRNTTQKSQPAAIRVFTLPSADVEVKEIIHQNAVTARKGTVSTVLLPGEALVFEVENKWNK